MPDNTSKAATLAVRLDVDKAVASSPGAGSIEKNELTRQLVTTRAEAVLFMA